MNGLLLFDKPCGPSSFAVVNHCKQLLRPSKIGHAGTLDPAASGLLVIALGKATGFLPYLPLEPKVYAFTVQFGSQTDTLDGEGSVILRDQPIPERSTITGLVPRFIGSIEQMPPDYSALKINGRRAYDLARHHEPVDLKPRTVVIHNLTLESFDADTGVAACTVCCAGGTYVRALARDLAAACGTVGFASSIRRCAIGPFTVESALPFNSEAAQMAHAVIPLEQAFATLPRIPLSALQESSCRHGHDINGVIEGSPEYGAAFSQDGRFVAIMVAADQGLLHPQRVLPLEHLSPLSAV